jgi:hypothetical protein
MSVLLVDEVPRVTASAAKRGVWQRLVRAVDAYCAHRSKWMLPAAALRRSRREMNRCRRLVRKPAAVRVEVGAGGAAPPKTGPSNDQACGTF